MEQGGFMKKRKRNYIVALILIVVGTSMFITNYDKEKASNILDKVSYSQYNSIVNSNKLSYIYIGRPTCSICQQFEPILNTYAQANNIDVSYLNIDTISSEEYNNLNEQLTATLNEDWDGSTPTMISVENGSIIDIMVGYDVPVGDTNLKTFFGIEDSQLNTLIDINMAQYFDMIKETKDNVIMIGRPTCSYCVQAIPVLRQISTEKKLDIYYLNIDTITQEEYAVLSESFDELRSFGTPFIIITNNNKLKAYQEGYLPYADMKTFFENNGF